MANPDRITGRGPTGGTDGLRDETLEREIFKHLPFYDPWALLSEGLGIARRFRRQEPPKIPGPTDPPDPDRTGEVPLIVSFESRRFGPDEFVGVSHPEPTPPPPGPRDPQPSP